VDCVGIINGQLCLVDFKTSAGIWPEMMVQVAAYRQLARECGHDVSQVFILRIGRTPDEGFEQCRVDHLDKRWQIFLHALAIYNLQKEVKQ